MDINNNTNITSQIASSISKLHLNSAKRAFETQTKEENTSIVELQEAKKDDIHLIDKTVREKNNGINVEEIQKYASSMGEDLSVDDINYGLMYGRSVIADYSA